MQFGTQKTTKVLDNNGSTITTEEKYVKGKPNNIVRRYYEVKVRVHNQKEEHEAYVSFSDAISKDKSMREPAFRIEHNKLGDESGYYYVVECYTKLEYRNPSK